MAELKQCPFCGGNASHSVDLICQSKYYFECQAHCEKCGAEIRMRYNAPHRVKSPQREAKRYIARLWNTRTPTADVVEVVRCEDCVHKRYCNQYVLIEADEKDLAFCSYGEMK